MATPRISIIIPCYNAEKLISDCLDGVLAQEYDNKEVVVIDGASVDRTMEIVRQYVAKHSNIRWLSEKDGGVYDAMNKGVGVSTGEWVYFLGADDGIYDTGVLKEIFSKGETAGFDIVYGDVEFKYSKQIYNGPYDLRRLLFESNICHQAIFYRRSVFEKVGLYDLACKIYADRDFNIRCFLGRGLRINYLDKVIAVYNEQDGLSAAVRADPDFRRKQTEYIKDYNRKPLRAIAIRMRRLAGWVKTAFQKAGEN